MSVEVDIRKKLNGFTLEVAFSAGAGQLGVLGASGCGKTMTLRCIAGISTPDEGRIAINGRTVFDSAQGINLPPQKRRAGFLFQQYALFPHLTVRQNLALVLRQKPAPEKNRVIADALAKFGLETLAGEKPPKLSGGQQQRAALARMLVTEPEIILLDEPFSALDSFLRDSVERELAQTLAGFSGTVLFVSHNRDEVYRICSRMLVLEKGAVARMGGRDEVFREPLALAAARLTGCKNIAAARKTGERGVFVPQWNLALVAARPVPDGLTHVGVRAHHIRPPVHGETENVFSFLVQSVEPLPFSLSEYVAVSGGSALQRIVESPEGTAFAPHGQTGAAEKLLCIPAEHLLLLKG